MGRERQEWRGERGKCGGGGKCDMYKGEGEPSDRNQSRAVVWMMEELFAEIAGKEELLAGRRGVCWEGLLIEWGVG